MKGNVGMDAGEAWRVGRGVEKRGGERKDVTRTRIVKING